MPWFFAVVAEFPVAVAVAVSEVPFFVVIVAKHCRALFNLNAARFIE